MTMEGVGKLEIYDLMINTAHRGKENLISLTPTQKKMFAQHRHDYFIGFITYVQTYAP